MTAAMASALNVSKNRLVISMTNLRMSGKLFIVIINSIFPAVHKAIKHLLELQTDKSDVRDVLK
jgi:hypothetical protein